MLSGASTPRSDRSSETSASASFISPTVQAQHEYRAAQASLERAQERFNLATSKLHGFDEDGPVDLLEDEFAAKFPDAEEGVHALLSAITDRFAEQHGMEDASRLVQPAMEQMAAKARDHGLSVTAAMYAAAITHVGFQSAHVNADALIAKHGAASAEAFKMERPDLDQATEFLAKSRIAEHMEAGLNEQAATEATENDMREFVLASALSDTNAAEGIYRQAMDAGYKPAEPSHLLAAQEDKFANHVPDYDEAKQHLLATLMGTHAEQHGEAEPAEQVQQQLEAGAQRALAQGLSVPATLYATAILRAGFKSSRVDADDLIAQHGAASREKFGSKDFDQAVEFLNAGLVKKHRNAGMNRREATDAAALDMREFILASALDQKDCASGLYKQAIEKGYVAPAYSEPGDLPSSESSPRSDFVMSGALASEPPPSPSSSAAQRRATTSHAPGSQATQTGPGASSQSTVGRKPLPPNSPLHQAAAKRPADPARASVSSGPTTSLGVLQEGKYDPPEAKREEFPPPLQWAANGIRRTYKAWSELSWTDLTGGKAHPRGANEGTGNALKPNEDRE